MITASSWNDIDGLAQTGIEKAAKELGWSFSDTAGYFLTGRTWDANTSDELAEEIIESASEEF